MVDGYRSSTAAPDHSVQAQIDEDLRNAERLKADFEKRFAVDPSANVVTMVRRSLQHPRADVLYPKLVAATEPGQWLMPLTRCLSWNHSRGDAGAAWAGMLAEMVRFTMSQVQ